ncbi:MAG: HAMP domain-containing histidine kinase [Clostridia bacterium]|nr:HAMP domain-containing histidine kinase [Clostridia bacterium]
MKQHRMRIYPYNLRELIIGLALIAVSLVMPRLINVETLPVTDYLFQALENTEKTDLLFSAMMLVVMNAVRGLPYYLGSFFVGESLEFSWKDKRTWITNLILMIIILRVNYFLINLLWGIRYDFGLPTILIFIFEAVIYSMRYSHISLRKKAMLIVFAIFAFEFLDIMPVISKLPVGRGEISRDIRAAAEILNARALLNIAGFIGMLLFLMFSVIIFIQLHMENRMKQIDELKKQNHEIMMEMQLSKLKNRANLEVQYLVHDLKSPLTSIETLAGLLKMRSSAEGRDTETEYLDRIEATTEHMSEMISEILYEDRRSAVTTDEILKIVLAQGSVLDCAQAIESENLASGKKIYANRIFFSRALSNLLQNSASALRGRSNPKIMICIAEDGENIRFSVRDNGRGIAPKEQKQVWERGFSGNTSSGLGLAFVKSVVENMNGTIEMDSRPNSGTTITITVAKESDAE